MKVVLEGHRLAATRDIGGVDSYWRQLVPQLLQARRGGDRLSLLTAFLDPRHARSFRSHIRAGAGMQHWWARPAWLDAARHLGARGEHFTGAADVIHVPEPVWKLPTAARVVVTLHDLMYLHHPQYLAPRWVERLQRGTEELAGTATLWICVSEHTRADLVRTCGVPAGRTLVVHHGVDPRFHGATARVEEVALALRAYGREERPYLLFLGSVEPKKNLPLLLEAYGLALRTGVRADLLVAGRAGWQAAAARATLERFPSLEERVQFLGFVADERLPGLVGGARALVLPSRYEGFGMPVVEAMAAGTPVLCSDRGALPEVAGDAARLFDAEDAEGLAALLAEVDSDDHLCENLRTQGLERARSFAWRDCAERTWEAYRTALTLPR